MHGDELEPYARIYNGALLQSNVLEAQEVRSPARNEPLGVTASHTASCVIIYEVICALLDALSDCELGSPSTIL